METSASATNKERKGRRRSKARPKMEPDIELANVDRNKEIEESTDNKIWIETETASETNDKDKKARKKFSKKKKVNLEASEKLVEDETEKKDEEKPVEEAETEETSVTKKKRFNFKLPDLNPLKMRKKRTESEEKAERDKNESKDSVEKDEKDDAADKKGMNTKIEKNAERENETLNDEEKSEAENVFHELPSASSSEKRDESGKKLSAKEKLKQKLDKKKSSEREPSSRLMRHLSTQSSRLEDRLKEEDHDAQIAFDRHDNVMKKKREKKSNEITAQDAFDFFTAIWDDNVTEEEAEKKVEKKKLKKEMKETEDEEEDDDDEDEEGYETASEELDNDGRKKLYSKDYIGSEYIWEVTEWQGPDIVPYTTRVENEKEIYYTPSPFPPSKEELQEVAVSMVSADEEGLYTGKYPSLQMGNINKMENRLLEERKHHQQQTNDWFSNSGHLSRLPNPLMKQSMRPQLEADDSDELTVYVPAVPGQAGHNLIAAPLSTAAGSAGLTCQLELDIASLVFSHHHLFSLEHYMTRRMTQLYHDYTNRLRNNAVHTLTTKLRTLYEESKRVEELIEVATDEEILFQKKRLSSYRTEIKAIRNERDLISKSEKELIKSILSAWKDLRDLRKKQNFTITGYKLLIHKEHTNVNEDKNAWNYEIEQEYMEKVHEFEETKDSNQKKYDEDLEKWKVLHAQRKEVRQRHKKHQRDMEKGRGSIDAKMFADDEELLAQPEPDKPSQPPQFSDNKVRQELETRAKEFRRHPGEPKLFLELHLNGKTTPVGDIYDNREINRRNAVTKTKIFFKVFFNGKEVCQSSLKLIGQDFIIPVGQIFPIQIIHWPETLKVQIIEGSTLRTSVLAEIDVPFPDSTSSIDKADVGVHDFVSDQLVSHGHAGLGSGHQFSTLADNSAIDTDTTRGQIYIRLGWATAQDGTILAPPSLGWEAAKKDVKIVDHVTDVFDSDGRVDPDKLEDWLLNHRIDPNDPRNADLMTSLSGARGGKPGLFSTFSEPLLKDEGYFRLDQMQDQFSFCSEAEIRNNLRFQLLQLRRAKAPEFRNYRMIPPVEKEIPRGIIESYTKKIEMSKKEVAGSSDPLRGKHRLYLEQIRAQVSHKFSIAKHKKRREDMIVEEAMPNLTTLFRMLGGIAPAQRPLRPVRSERKKVTIQDLSGQDVKLLLCVVRAYDVPVRHDVDPVTVPATNQGYTNPGAGHRESIVRSYVEATFQSSTVRTVVAEGPNPAWNQNLELSFKPPNNDFSPENMKQVQDSLHLHLFDEVRVDILDDERDRDARIHQRLENRWLGSLSIPFSSLYQNTRIEGTFKLHSPSVLLGYERLGLSVQQHLGWRPTTPTDTGSVDKDATYLNIYLTIQPALNVPEPVREKLDCEEPDQVLEMANKWSDAMVSTYSHRQVNPLVIDVEGKAVLMTRYFRGIMPPQELFTKVDDICKTQVVAWYVSLIPYTPSNAYFPGLGDIWPDSDKFMQMMLGTEAEHAILLTNYFTGMNKTAYMVLGHGVPEGKTAYVLTFEENGEHWLWNAVTGEHYVTTETFCPLTCVYALVNSSNMWSNLQPGDPPGRLRWDLGNSSDWSPMFPGGVPPSPMSSLQPDQIHLSQVDHRSAKLLKDRIEKTLRDTIMNLRRKINLRTSLNFQGKAILSKLLPGLETARLGNSNHGRGLSQEHLSELQRIMSSHKVCGFPLHFGYSDLESIIEAVKATGVHLDRDPGVEFSLAVMVEPYPGSVMSVWVYVASIVRRR